MESQLYDRQKKTEVGLSVSIRLLCSHYTGYLFAPALKLSGIL